MTDQNLDNLAERVLFLNIAFNRFGNTRRADVNVDSHANQSRFSISKRLLESPELKAIAVEDGKIKAAVAGMSLPYEIGCLLIPVANSNAAKVLLEEYQKTGRPALVNAFLSVYSSQIEESKVQLKEQFNPNEYPSLEAVKEEFGFKFRFTSLSLPDSLKDSAQSMIMDAAAAVSDALAVAAHEAVSKLADSLSEGSDGKPKKIYDGQFKKLQEFLEGFDIKNVTNQKDLKAEMDTLKGLMSGLDADKVRHNEGLRAELHKKFSEATEKLTVMVQFKGRKFRDA